jgi:hypothetical protein
MDEPARTAGTSAAQSRRAKRAAHRADVGNYFTSSWASGQHTLPTHSNGGQTTIEQAEKMSHSINATRMKLKTFLYNVLIYSKL